MSAMATSLHRAAGRLEGVDHRPAAAAAAADQGQADRVVLGGVDVRNGHAGQGGAGDQASALLQEIPAATTWILRSSGLSLGKGGVLPVTWPVGGWRHSTTRRWPRATRKRKNVVHR